MQTKRESAQSSTKFLLVSITLFSYTSYKEYRQMKQSLLALFLSAEFAFSISSLITLKIQTSMANETNDFTAAVSALLDTAGKVAQQQLEVVNTGFSAIMQVVEPLAKTAIDLVGSASNTVGQVFQNVAEAIAPKK